jgi:hypothetical protein
VVESKSAGRISSQVEVIPCVDLSPDSIECTGEIMMLAPIALRELCIALDLPIPETDRKLGYTSCPITQGHTFFLKQESHALRLGVRAPFRDSGERRFCGRFAAIAHLKGRVITRF